MEGLEAQLRRLRLDKGLVDVTSEFRELASRMVPESVIKAPSFDLFEGTHSLEIDNPKLDSSLLALTEKELNFDCTKVYGEATEQKVEFVTAVVDRLCRTIVLWLNDFQTLPTTVLSCRYVAHILCQFTEDPCADLSSCQLETGDELFDQVLASCVIAVCYFVKFVQTLFKAGVVYEEEDLNCNAMGLNVLSTVQLPTVKSHLARSQKLLEKSYPQAHQLQMLLMLLMHLVEVYGLLPTYFGSTSQVDHEHTLNKLIETSRDLEQFPLPDGTVYQGAFSAVIQKKMSNQFPPRDIILPTGKEYTALADMVQDLRFVLSVDQAKTVTEIAQFSRFFNRVRPLHVVARAFYPLNLMRDDQTVLAQYTFDEYSQLHLEEFSFCDTELYKLLKNEPQTSGVKQKFQDFLQEISGALFEWYQTSSQNPCRSRQGFNRQLLMWDSLQAQIETYELELESQGIADQLEDGSSFMPLTTWVFYMKLRAMLDFVLKGFELDVYKPWEFFSMFWYSYYLAQHLENTLHRVLNFIEARIDSMVALNKKIKKLKAGEKKEKLREAYRAGMSSQMPVLMKNKDFIKYSLLDCSVIKILSLAQVFQFAVLKSFGLIDNQHPGSGRFSSPERVHKLRFKTFASIGVPELPSYGSFQQSLQDFVITEPMFETKLARSLDFNEVELSKVKSSLQSVFQDIEADSGQTRARAGTQLVQKQALEYYQGLLRSTDALIINGKTLRSKLGNRRRDDLSTAYTVGISRTQGGCSYFPLLKLDQRKP
ncbi:LADA_0G13520g1_1 [Lachancea dasiensis]|uniref:LADA_0G13520g1_1 n=1 Tax=Lachancea dasiensis TaxID=1072105 RepID=A0A1G4JVN7_9SACH|nr:LADA_0G13520g1_1 [Lachancea dasiensis]